MRHQLRQVPVKQKRLVRPLHSQPPLVAPSHQPLQQFNPAQYQRFPQPLRVGLRLRKPLDELLVLKREKFLLMRGPTRQFHHFRQRLDLLARAMP